METKPFYPTITIHVSRKWKRRIWITHLNKSRHQSTEGLSANYTKKSTNYIKNHNIQQNETLTLKKENVTSIFFFLLLWILQMSDSRVSSVIQEWAYPGQVHPHPQTLNPNTSNHTGLTNHLAQIDMIPYGQSHGMRGGSDDRVTEQMMGLSYLPYNSSCLSNTSGAESQHQSQINTQQVCVCDFIIITSIPS